MSNRKIINAASTGGIGYYPIISSSTTDTYYDNVSLLLNGDVEVDDNFANVSLLLTGNDLLDKSNNKFTITNTGSVTVSSTIKQFGTGSLYFSGSNYLDVPASSMFSFSGDFTVEAWINFQAPGGAFNTLVDFRSTNGASTGFAIHTDSTGYIGVWTGGGFVTGLAGAVPLNIWKHVAIVRSGSNWYGFINGVQSFTYTSAVNFTDTDCRIGSNEPNNCPTKGYIDDLRITKGVARYTSNFTPPVKALPTHEILDSSVYRLPVTAYGNARIDAATKKFGTGAMYFDGSGDYLTLLPNINLAFPADFTIELWFNSSSFAAQRTLMSTAGYYVAGNNGNWTFRVTNASSIAFTQYNSQSPGGGGWEFTVPVMSTDTWYHVAVARSNGTISLYLNGTASSTTYSNSSNISDGSVSNVYVGRNVSYDNDWIGYIDDLRITKGYARYTTNFTPPTASLPTIPPTIPADPWWGNVSLLLDGNTTDAYDPYWQNVSLMLTGDDFIDWSNQHNAITVVGNTAINTTTKKFSTGSMYFDGGGDYLRIPDSPQLQITGGNFTIELWSYPLTGKQFPCLFSNYNSTSWAANTGVGLYAGHAGTGDTTHYKLAWNGTWPKLTSSATINFNAWTHIALVKNGSTITLYLNGIADSSFTDSSNSYTAPMWWIGTGGYTPDNSDEFNGYIDDLRFTKGIARYTANFTPPIAALPSYKIQDRTQNNLTVTPYGNVQLSTDVMKNGTGSMFFGGGHVYFPNSDIFDLSAKDFTLEAWIYPVNFSDYGQIFSKRGNSDRSWQMYTDYGTGWLSFSIAAGSNFNSTSTPPLNSWSHAALSYTYSNTTARLFLNGVLVYTLTSASFDHKAENIGIGSIPYPDGSQRFYGCIDDARITKGYARYTQNFTPPSQSFATQYISTGYDANYADVSLLLNGNGTNGSQVFTDLSGTPKTITAYGDAKISTAVKKYGTGAMAFDGSGDHLTISQGSFNAGTGDFTIEAWVHPTTYNTYNYIYLSSSSDAGLLFGVSDSQLRLRSYFTQDLLSSATGTIPALNTWSHVAVSRANGITNIFLNGISVASGTITYSFVANSSAFVGGSSRESFYFTGYIDDLRITKGIARYTSNFTPPTYQLPTDTTGTVIDPLRSSTSLLLRGNGTNGSTSFTDESPNGLTVTAYGSVTVNTTTKKYGTGSMYFDGTGDYVNVAGTSVLDIKTGDFTLEAWIYPTVSHTNYGRIFHFGPTWTSNCYGFSFDHIGKFKFESANLNSGAAMITSSSVITVNAWSHVAVTRSGSLFNLFVNGISQGTYTDAAALSSTANQPLYIGMDPNGSAAYTGYIDDLRITKGYARYTSSFTPPTYEDPIVTGTVYDYNYPQVSLLLNGDGTNGSTVFTDLSSSPKAITTYGNAQISTTTKKFGTGSMYFDGTGDWLLSNSLSSNALGAGDFTVECWVNVPAISGGYAAIVADNSYGVGSNGWAVYQNGAAIEVWQDVGNIHTISSALNVNTWIHIAWVRIGTSSKVYINGVASSLVSNSTAYSGTQYWVGARGPTSGSYPFTGYIDDLRITKGLARYTQNFTPPTAPLPTSYS